LLPHRLQLLRGLAAAGSVDRIKSDDPSQRAWQPARFRSRLDLAPLHPLEFEQQMAKPVVPCRQLIALGHSRQQQRAKTINVIGHYSCCDGSFRYLCPYAPASLDLQHVIQYPDAKDPSGSHLLAGPDDPMNPRDLLQVKRIAWMRRVEAQ
jgi:hypothetical protein